MEVSIMAKTNSTVRPTINKQAAMLADLTSAADMLKGATGFLFAAKMPDGSMSWIAGGDLICYDNATAGAAMQLYIEAQRCSLSKAA
jgi:hypothetical protein